MTKLLRATSSAFHFHIISGLISAKFVVATTSLALYASISLAIFHKWPIQIHVSNLLGCHCMNGNEWNGNVRTEEDCEILTTEQSKVLDIFCNMQWKLYPHWTVDVNTGNTNLKCVPLSLACALSPVRCFHSFAYYAITARFMGEYFPVHVLVFRIKYAARVAGALFSNFPRNYAAGAFVATAAATAGLRKMTNFYSLSFSLSRLDRQTATEQLNA